MEVWAPPKSDSVSLSRLRRGTFLGWLIVTLVGCSDRGVCLQGGRGGQGRALSEDRQLDRRPPYPSRPRKVVGRGYAQR